MINIDDSRQKANFLRKDEPKAIPIAQRRKTEPSRIRQIARDRSMNEFQEAAKAVIAAYETSKKAAALNPLEATLAPKIYKALQKLKRRLLAAATLSEAEAAPEDRAKFDKLWNIVNDIDFQDFDYMNLTYAETNKAFAEGWENGKEPLIGQNPNLVASFGSIHPEVVQASYRVRAANRVTEVDWATKAGIRELLTLGRVEGTSYREFARDLSGSFAFSRERAHLIAVTELADAYEEGNSQPSKMLSNIGFKMQKSWLLLGDEKVCDLCIDNQMLGWIDEDVEFAHGADHPPQHPRCRCAADRRMDPEAAMPEPMAPAPPSGDFRTFTHSNETDAWGYGSSSVGPKYTPEGALILSRGDFTKPIPSGGAYSEWAQSLDVDTRMAFDDYTGGGYDSINKLMSGQELIQGYDDPDLAETNALLMRTALKSASLPENVVTFRGTNGSFVYGAKIGDVIDYPIFASTSLIETTAQSFARANQDYGNQDDFRSAVVYRIRAPKGLKAAYLGNQLGLGGETELLIEPDTSWLIVEDRAVKTVLDGMDFEYRELTLEATEKTVSGFTDVTEEVVRQPIAVEEAKVRKSSIAKFNDQPGQFKIRRPLPR